MSQVLEEIREAYRSVGIRLADSAAYGTYYTLRCTGCDRYLGVVGDRLLPGLAAELIEAQRDLYAQGDPLPAFPRGNGAGRYRFNEGEALPEEYRGLLLKMLAHEGERAGNKSFWGFMSTCADLAEALAPSEEAKSGKAEYLAEEMKHAILPRESWADDAFFHFFVDLNGAFHSRDWRESSYVPLMKIAATVERDELGHSEMGYRFLMGICRDARGKALAQHLLDKWYPAALDMFGRSDSCNAPKFIQWGLKGVGNAEIRQAYKQYADRKIEALGLRAPDEGKNRFFL